MESSANLLRFGSDTPMLGAPALIAIAVAVAALFAWLIAGTEKPTLIDIGIWIVVGGFAVIVIGYTGTWNEVLVDATTRQITVRHGFLQYRWDWMGQKVRFADITAVIVEQKTTEETEKSDLSSGSTRTVYRKTYTLSLVRADTTVSMPDRQVAVPHYAIDLPMKNDKDPLVLEGAARQLARLGAWPAKRRGYALLPGGGSNVKSESSTVESPIDAD